MNKRVAAKWAFAASLVLVLPYVMTAQAKAQIPDRTLSFREISQTLNQPQAIARYIWHNFVFEDDTRQFGAADYWQTPEELLATGRGDCEDFALFAREALRLNGKSAYLLNVYGDRYSHTVCLLKEDSGYQVIDGTEVFDVDSANLREVASFLYPYWKSAAIVEPAPAKKGRVLAQFDKKISAYRRIATSA